MPIDKGMRIKIPKHIAEEVISLLPADVTPTHYLVGLILKDLMTHNRKVNRYADKKPVRGNNTNSTQSP